MLDIIRQMVICWSTDRRPMLKHVTRKSIYIYHRAGPCKGRVGTFKEG